MNQEFITERDLMAKAYREAVATGDPCAPAICERLAKCQNNIQLDNWVDCLASAAGFRRLAIGESDPEASSRFDREAILAEREARLIWDAATGSEALLSDADIAVATIDQLGAHAAQVYRDNLAKEAGAGV